MRGKGYLEPFYSIYHRITPAYAGKSRTFATSCYCIQDHPRLCGEKLDKAFGLLLVWGSPPPMRGKDHPVPNAKYTHRITPAYAGKSPLSGGVGASLRDHPRLCGEKAADTYHPHYHVGSPPPMRGKVENAR